MLEIESFLHPVTPDAPGGPNLEYSPAFAELERKLRGKPERQMGETIIAAEDPDWRAVSEDASALLMESKDLRVAIPFVRALLATDGYRGLAGGLALIVQLVAGFWPSLHPRLDEEDNDATARINALAALTHRDMLQAVRSARIALSRTFGPITLRNLEGATSQNGDGKPGAIPSAQAALDDLPLAELTEAAGWVSQCEQAAKDLEVAWNSHLDAGSPDFADLRRLLGQADTMMKSRLAARAPATDGGAPELVAGEGPSGGGAAAAHRGELRSRDDVVRAIEGLCAYYARHEPSSPVPLLLQRCKRLVPMSFIDIVKDMLPDGLSTIQTIAGKQND